MTDENRPDERWVHDEPTGAALRVPLGWDEVSAPVGVAVAPRAWVAAPGHVPYRPNVTLVVGPAEASDPREVGTQALAQVLAGADEAHLLGYDLVRAADRPEGRCLHYAYRHGEYGIAVSQWLFVANGLVTAVTGSCGVDAAVQVGPWFAFVAGTVRLPVRGWAA